MYVPGAVPRPVSIAGVRPQNRTMLPLSSAVLVAGILGLLTSIVVDYPVGIVLTIGMVLVGGIFLFASLLALVNVNKPCATAGPDGIWTRTFQLRWDEIRALDFVDGTFRFILTSPHLTHVDPRVMLTSLVVSTRAVDAHGRPIQYGNTMFVRNTRNFDEFRTAVSAFDPRVRFTAVLGADDYTPDPAMQTFLRSQLDTYGMVSIKDRRGRPRIAVDVRGIGLEDGRIVAWADIAGLHAVTDVYTDRNGIDTSIRTNRLVIVTRQLDSRGETIVHRPECGIDDAPPLEQVMLLIRSLAPHVVFTDERRVEPAQAARSRSAVR